ncbi:MAG: YbjQ family protein [Pseudomonadota bacterium]
MSDPYNSTPSGGAPQAPSVPRSPPTGAPALNDAMVTTAQELPGYRIVENLGIVRGLAVRSRSVVGSFIGGLQTLFGGNITIYTELCEQTRADTYRDMLAHARQKRANAIIGMRYDATEVMPGLTEVLCYGTAVIVERIPR